MNMALVESVFTTADLGWIPDHFMDKVSQSVEIGSWKGELLSMISLESRLALCGNTKPFESFMSLYLSNLRSLVAESKLAEEEYLNFLVYLCNGFNRNEVMPQALRLVAFEKLLYISDEMQFGRNKYTTLQSEDQKTITLVEPDITCTPCYEVDLGTEKVTHVEGMLDLRNYLGTERPIVYMDRIKSRKSAFIQLMNQYPGLTLRRVCSNPIHAEL